MAENRDVGFTPDSSNPDNQVSFTPDDGAATGSSSSSSVGTSGTQGSNGFSGGTGSSMDENRNRVADGLDRASSMLDDQARTLEQRGGAAGRAAGVARNASTALESGAEYVRNKDVDAMKEDLAGRIRENPLMSVGIALGAGFIISRILD